MFKRWPDYVRSQGVLPMTSQFTFQHRHTRRRPGIYNSGTLRNRHCPVQCVSVSLTYAEPGGRADFDVYGGFYEVLSNGKVIVLA